MSMPGPMELILILVIVMVLFGAKRLPGLGEALGKGIHNFKKTIGGKEDVIVNHTNKTGEKQDA